MKCAREQDCTRGRMHNGHVLGNVLLHPDLDGLGLLALHEFLNVRVRPRRQQRRALAHGRTGALRLSALQRNSSGCSRPPQLLHGWPVPSAAARCTGCPLYHGPTTHTTRTTDPHHLNARTHGWPWAGRLATWPGQNGRKAVQTDRESAAPGPHGTRSKHTVLTCRTRSTATATTSAPAAAPQAPLVL